MVLKNANGIVVMKEQTRNYSLDLLRIVAMLMIVTIHVNGHGGVLRR